jgi:hypothetical protein
MTRPGPVRVARNMPSPPNRMFWRFVEKGGKEKKKKSRNVNREVP